MRSRRRTTAEPKTSKHDKVASLPLGSSEPDELVRAAWLYYIAEYTQAQTATILGVSRMKVARLLAEARGTGIVKISIEHRLTPMAEVEEYLRRQFGLSFCQATPPLNFPQALAGGTPGPGKRLRPANVSLENELARRAVGMTAARFLRERLLGSEKLVVGLAWGRTTAAMVDQLSGVRKPDATFVSLLGSLTLSSAANIFEVVHRLAEKTGGEGHFLPVPYIANSVRDRNILVAQRIVQEALELAARADLHFISLGECDRRGFLFEGGYLSVGELADLHAVGAVGDAMGKFFNQTGQAVESELNQRTLALDTRHLHGREVVLLCAGSTKVRAVRGLLRAGYVKGLIIDGDTALKVYEQEAESITLVR